MFVQLTYDDRPFAGPPRPPSELPHGFLEPPEEVCKAVAEEFACLKAKFRTEVLPAEVEERILCDWTLQYYFEPQGYEVLYQSTPAGPVVVAVGDEERITFTRGMSLGVRAGFKSWLPR